MGAKKPKEVTWHDEAPEGKLDLLVTLDFRMSTTCVYSDIVLPTATWYEKNDLNTSDMHPFIHPLTGAVDPVWEAKSDWEIYKAHRQDVLRGGARGAGRREGCRADTDHARHAGRDRAGDGCQGLEARRVRPGPRQDDAGGHGRRARLSEHLQALHVARSADVEDRQRRQGYRLEHRARGRVPQAPEWRGDRGWPDQGSGAHRDRHRCRRGDPVARAGDQRRGGGQGLGELCRRRRAATTLISRCRRRTRRSASAMSSHSHARSSRRPSGRVSKARRSATTPATRTSTS